MQARPFHLAKLAIATLIASPAFVFAVPATSPYYTDTVNSYVQDQVSKDMEELNGFLCLINAMAPSQMVNEPDYIAMVDLKSCRPNTQNNNNMNGNTGANYFAVQLNSSRESNSMPMLTKIWLDDFIDTTMNTTINVPMYASASQAPSKTVPYGVFRLDYCKLFPGDTVCNKHIGYINATKSGLSFYTLDYKTGQYGEYYNEFALQLGASSTTNTGSGIVIKTNTNNSIGSVTTSAVVFAHNSDFFYRDDGVNTPQCFDRASGKAEESVWRYGLYHTDTGERFEHQSGFPIEYVYTSSNSTMSGTVGATYNGYVGYYGLWLPVDLPSNETVYKINYETYPPTKIPYTLLKSGGKLTKSSTIFLTLKDLHKSPFGYYPSANVTDDSAIVVMTANQNYEIYWDDANKKFYVYSHYNNKTYKNDIYPTPLAVNNSSLVAADINQWGLSGWSPLLGTSFTIKYADFAQLPAPVSPKTESDIRVITQSYDVVYPSEFASINNTGGLKCIGDCPTAAQIGLYNTDLALAFPTGVSPFLNPNWGPFNGIANVTYSLDATSGNLFDGPPSGVNSSGSAVIQTTSNNIYSGRLVTASDMAYVNSIKAGCVAPCYSQSDLDLLADRVDVNGNPVNYSYYYWESSSNNWNQMSYLLDSTNVAVTFYPALPVTFNIPNTTKYGSHAGTTVGLQYGDFGNLWGIPYKCVDLRNNADCVYYDATVPTYDPAISAVVTPYDKQYWTAEYSIPYDATLGVVTAAIAQGNIGESGYVAKGTKFLVKSLEKEIRLAKVPVGICTVQGLGQNVSVTKLPSSSQWIDPAIIGTKPVLNPVPSPRVIHGVKQY